MAESIVPISPNNLPPLPPAKGNIASLVNPDTIKTLGSIKDPKSFGDQSKSIINQKVIQGIGESTLDILSKQKAVLIQEGIQLDINHQKKLQEIELKYKTQPQNEQTQIAYQDDLVMENGGGYLSTDPERKNLIKGDYPTAKEDLQERKDKNQKDIDFFLKDPFKKQKDELKKREKARKKALSKSKADRSKARKERAKAVLKNAKKTLVPILALLLTNKIADVVSQNSKIQELVDKTNTLITEANNSGDQTKLNNAKTARDNAIRIIQNNQEKVQRIQSDINRISSYISIFTTIISIISAIPIPTSVPPGIGIPTSLIIKFVKILEKANKILLALSALIPILLTALDKAISILEDLKSQLLDINGQLDKAATSGGGGILDNGTNTLSNTSLLSTPDNFGVSQTGYKGFTFAIREENDPKFVVRGFKRHYAVAIDSYGVEVLKSESSFTLDPNDLIEQLKLAIDQQGLTPGTGLGGNSLAPKSQTNQQSQTNQTNQTNQQAQLSLPTAQFNIASSSTISRAQSAVKKQPPQPKFIIGPAGSGITAQIPLGIIKKAQLIAQAAASGPDPRPKIDVAFIIAADQKWQADYKKYQRNAASDITGLPS